MNNCSTYRKNSIGCLFLLLFFSLFSDRASAQDTLNASHSADHASYVPGAVLTMTNRIEYTSTLTSLGMEVNLPKGWSYVAVNKSEPLIRVTNTGELEIFWESVPTSPVEFEYKVKTPEEALSDQKIESRILYHRSSETERIAPVLPDSLFFEIAGDINDDGSLTLADAVIALKVAAKDTAADVRADYAESGIDVNGDDKVGVEEAIFILTKMTGKNIK